LLLHIKYNDEEDPMDHLIEKSKLELYSNNSLIIPDGSHVYAPASRAIKSPAAFQEKSFS
jgi:hypothetical protein